MLHHLSLQEIAACIEDLKGSPRDEGRLDYIVLRPGIDRRTELQEAELSPEEGLFGDRWSKEENPDRDTQISVINSRFLRAIAGEEERMLLSGDNLIIDLDLSEENMPTGTRVRIGTAILEVTWHPHNGCSKFKHRFGADAMQTVNSETMKQMRLRGLFMTIIEGGKVRVGDLVTKLP